MSSLRNSLHRRNHKERSQLAQRARLGILEKHKDYVLRARDYHSKQDRITRLRQKAAERNKDEFYFGMTRQKTEKGVHVQERGNVALPVDIVKVLKTQDENYMRTMRTAGLKKIDKLKGQLSALADLVKANVLGEEDDEDELDEEELQILREAGIIAGPSSVGRRRRKSTSSRAKHIVFAESDDQARQYAITPRQKPMDKGIKSNPDADSETEDMGWKAPEEQRRKKRKEKAYVLNGQDDSGTLEEERREQALKHRSQLLKELSARLQRDKQLRYAERELEMQKLLMGKGASRKLSGIEKLEEEGDNEESEEEDKKRPKKVDEKTWRPRVYKWRVERKR